MASILAPPQPPSPDVGNAQQPKSILPVSRAPSPEVGDAMQVESPPPDGTSQAAAESTEPGGDDDMQVDAPGTNSEVATEPRRSTRKIKPVQHDFDMKEAASAPPPRKSKGKQPPRRSKGKQGGDTPIPVKSATLHSRALVIGSKYMQFSLIDLTQVEVSTILVLCFGASNLRFLTSAHLLRWNSPKFP